MFGVSHLVLPTSRFRSSLTASAPRLIRNTVGRQGRRSYRGRSGCRNLETDAGTPSASSRGGMERWIATRGFLTSNFDCLSPPVIPRCPATSRHHELGWRPYFQVSTLERETGIEPATFSLARRRSTTELLPLAVRGEGVYRRAGPTGRGSRR